MTRRTLLILVAIGLVTAGPSARQAQDRLTADVLKGLELPQHRPGHRDRPRRRTSRSIRRTRTSGTSPRRSAGCGRPSIAASTFTPIFDDGGSFTLCCVVIDPKNSNVLWLGTGENTSQRSAHFGDGVYKSTDAGKTWKRVGLETSEHIGKILIDPRNSNVVYVAVAGAALFGRAASAASTRRPTAARRGTRVLHDQRRHRHQRHRVRSEERRRHLRVGLSAPARTSAR